MWNTWCCAVLWDCSIDAMTRHAGDNEANNLNGGALCISHCEPQKMAMASWNSAFLIFFSHSAEEFRLMHVCCILTPLSAQISLQNFRIYAKFDWKSVVSDSNTHSKFETSLKILKTHTNFWCRGINNKHHAVEMWDLEFGFQTPRKISPFRSVMFARNYDSVQKFCSLFYNLLL